MFSTAVVLLRRFLLFLKIKSFLFVQQPQRKGSVTNISFTTLLESLFLKVVLIFWSVLSGMMRLAWASNPQQTTTNRLRVISILSNQLKGDHFDSLSFSLNFINIFSRVALLKTIVIPPDHCALICLSTF